jgi:hypothetical protein
MKSMKLSHDRRMWCMASKESLMVTSNLLKPTRLIELVNYVKVVKVIENPKFSQTCPENILLQT